MSLPVLGQYIATKIEQHAEGRTLRVLDMGCGVGKIIEGLLPSGHDFYGYDFERRRESATARLSAHYGESFDDHIRFTEDERRIPFDDLQFDLIYAIQVFEHVRFLELMLAESARVLRPDGHLIITFPLATAPIEQHLGIPFAQWLPPGQFRVRYLWSWYALSLRPRKSGRSAFETAVEWDRYLSNQTYYRFFNEFRSLGEYFFQQVEVDTGSTVKVRLTQMASGSGPKAALARWLLNADSPRFYDFLSHFYNVTLILSQPRQDSIQR